MDMPILNIKKNYDDAIIPVKAHPTDSGFDLFAYKFIKSYSSVEKKELNGKGLKSYDLMPFSSLLVDTGISATVGPGYEIQIRPRSGLALKKGISVLNTPGTIDETYRGLIGVILVNHFENSVRINIGDKIAQMVVCPVILPDIEVVDSLDETKRGEKGFGHTGV